MTRLACLCTRAARMRAYIYCSQSFVMDRAGAGLHGARGSVATRRYQRLGLRGGSPSLVATTQRLLRLGSTTTAVPVAESSPRWVTAF